jgi:protoheme IX farnesyltransferase
MLQGHPIPVLLRAPRALNWRLVFELFKLRIGLAIGLAALAGLAVTPGPTASLRQIAALAVAVTLCAAAAGAFNQIVERDLDARMRRTRNRAFATGRLKAGPVWYAAIGAIGVAGAALAGYELNVRTAIYTLLGAFTYAVVYTIWLKRRTPWNIVIGGLAGSFAVLAGGAAVSSRLLEPMTWAFALILFLWTPPHFWSLAIAYHDDYAAAKVPMLPVVLGDTRAARWVLVGAALLVGASLLPTLLGMSWIYSVSAALVGAYLLRSSARLARAPSKSAAMINFHTTLVYLGVLLGAAIIDAALRR